MKHLPLGERQKLTTYRKIALASWHHPRDPSTYSWIDLPVEAAEAFLKSLPDEPRPTLTHLVAKIIAQCLQKHPDLDHIQRLGQLQRRGRTDIYVTTLLKGKGSLDLSGFTLPDVPGKTLGELAKISQDAVEALREGSDPITAKTDAVVEKMPVWLLKLVLRVQSFFQYTLNLSLRAAGIPDDRFGSVIISNFGPLGLENGLVPLSPYCRCPLMIGMGKPRPIPYVEGDSVVVKECITITLTFDHRYADGAHGAQLMRLFQKMFLNPEKYFATP
jgi:pyruvate dehydrogenase E2 component (dihydrolipoamide acetyltransferase)